MKISTVYFFIKAIALKLPIQTVTWIDFVIMSLFLVAPSFFAIFYGGITKSEGQKLGNQLGKYSNCCSDLESLQRVSRALICIIFLIKIYLFHADERINTKVTESSDSFILWLFQHRLAAWAINSRNHHNLFDHHLPV